eukprot:6484908-Prorocentrum_lima.AAC.1
MLVSIVKRVVLVKAQKLHMPHQHLEARVAVIPIIRGIPCPGLRRLRQPPCPSRPTPLAGAFLAAPGRLDLEG